MLYPLSVFLAVTLMLVSSTWGHIITYLPSKGGGVSYSFNIPENTASDINGTIYLQLSAPSHARWIALGQGERMAGGSIFLIYPSPDGSVTLSPRKAFGHLDVFYDPNIQAYLLEGSGVHDGVMTANIRCDNCMHLDNGDNIMGSSSPWSWAMCHGYPLVSSDVAVQIHKHDIHGSFTLDLTRAIGGNSSNPFLDLTYLHHDVTPSSREHVIDDASLYSKRVAHGVMTPIAFVLMFPGFGLLLHIYPTRHTVLWMHAPMQIIAACVALIGLGFGVSVSMDLKLSKGYHPTIGYVLVGVVVLIQPVIGIVQHLHFRRSGGTTIYGVLHRWFGRLLSAIGILNGGLGFYYAYQHTEDIPPVPPIIYGMVCGGVCMLYVFVVMWRREKTSSQAVIAQLQTESLQNKSGLDQGSDNLDRAQSGSVESSSILEKKWQLS
ncbi:hypothetical protein BDV32DRAFT_157495 [Aspergillus pseudonomiae]|uniref:Cellobiose dehydrogenase-like cytochrome domain-containing protein n=1 Tax=Aspergillus pseudonomiae TaxID=1506151 RepID=A0A5N7CSP3_9EURO|nr:uncharacterized protein BDV37DRAFT_292232 [Aspergillus pseudonomiae]KAB8253932.1 hypothetical protein BDV32DRAFT_157495 [Aspergillus pseudonomiae]KAE8397262.1 hypothetical protein BDV37DRAFT_292232 [Aspergillus pseudonomiae]